MCNTPIKLIDQYILPNSSFLDAEHDILLLNEIIIIKRLKP